MSIFESVQGKLSGVTGGGSGLGALAGSGAAAIGTGLIKSRLPTQMGPMVDTAFGAAKSILAGDWAGAAKKALNSGIFTAKLPWLDGAAASAFFQMQPSKAMGGVEPQVAKKMMQESIQTNFGRKNLFIVELLSYRVDESFGLGVEWPSDSGKYARLNMFVSDVSYGPITLTGDRQKVGSASLDQLTGSEHIELRLTTFDDESGSVKSWFTNLAKAAARRDGTFGVPEEYLAQIRVTHSFVTDDSARLWLQGEEPWSATAWFRPVSMELDLSRKDDAIEELTLVFTQYDTTYT